MEAFYCHHSLHYKTFWLSAGGKWDEGCVKVTHLCVCVCVALFVCSSLRRLIIQTVIMSVLVIVGHFKQSYKWHAVVTAREDSLRSSLVSNRSYTLFGRLPHATGMCMTQCQIDLHGPRIKI